MQDDKPPQVPSVQRSTPGDYIAGIARERGMSLLAAFGAVGAGTGFVLLLGFMGIVDLVFMYDNWGSFLEPAIVALLLTNGAFFIGFFAALPVGLVRAYGISLLRRSRVRGGAKTKGKRWKPTRRDVRRGLKKLAIAPAYGLATGYVEGIRGTPFYVQMFMVFYFVLIVWPKLPYVYFWAALLGLTINTLGYQAEVLRGGFQSVGEGQIEAAKALGMRGTQIFSHISFPQAIRLVFLPLTNEWIGLFKATALLIYFSIVEPMFQAFELGSVEGHPIEAFVMVSVVYLIILIPVSRLLTYIEGRRRIPGLGVPTGAEAKGRARAARA